MGMKRRPVPAPPLPEPEPADDAPKVADTTALKRLAERLDTNVDQIDNSALHAGSPMYFYCKLCNHFAGSRPEGYWGSPPKHCKECKELIEVTGLTPTTLLELVKDYRKEPAA